MTIKKKTNTTSLTPPQFIEVPVPSKEGELSFTIEVPVPSKEGACTKQGRWAVIYLCVRDIDFASFYYLSIGFWVAMK